MSAEDACLEGIPAELRHQIYDQLGMGKPIIRAYFEQSGLEYTVHSHDDSKCIQSAAALCATSKAIRAEVLGYFFPNTKFEITRCNDFLDSHMPTLSPPLHFLFKHLRDATLSFYLPHMDVVQGLNGQRRLLTPIFWGKVHITVSKEDEITCSTEFQLGEQQVTQSEVAHMDYESQRTSLEVGRVVEEARW